MTEHPAAREMIGCLFVRGGLYIIAYGKSSCVQQHKKTGHIGGRLLNVL
jgi:Mn-containing catalase